ncbi:MAG: hypothetical protein AAF491_04550 [Verrucomicrobiota bacterium]
MSRAADQNPKHTQVRPWVWIVTASSIALAAFFLPKVFQDEETITALPPKGADSVSTSPPPGPAGDSNSSPPKASAAGEMNLEEETIFLETDYEPLSKWLEERFEVSYENMTPELIFDQVPLNDIFYEVLVVPGNPDEFNLKSENISRRELLEKIAQHWDLEMSYSVDESGTPTAVKVVGPDFL